MTSISCEITRKRARDDGRETREVEGDFMATEGGDAGAVSAGSAH